MLLRIFFTGLVAFAPSADESEMTVLLSDTKHRHAHTSDTVVERHEPLLLARADACEGACRPPSEHERTYRFLFPKESELPGRAERALAKTIDEGGYWSLDGSDLTLRFDRDQALRSGNLQVEHGQPQRLADAIQLPRTSSDLASFDWVPAMSSISPGAGVIDPDVLSRHPQKGLIKARLTLQTGTIRTYSVAQFDGKVLPVRFATGDAEQTSQPIRALADWVVAEIPIEGCSVTLADSSFSEQRPRRTMTLSVSAETCASGHGTLDLVIMNLPVSSFELLTAEEPSVDDMTGHHFDYYYALSASPPERHRRMLPSPVLDVDPALLLEVGKAAEDNSALLDAILRLPPRGVLSRPLCPPVQFNTTTVAASTADTASPAPLPMADVP